MKKTTAATHQDWINDLSFSVLHLFEETGDALGDVERVDVAGLAIQGDQNSHHLKMRRASVS